MKIFLAGEGIAELGDWSVARQYRGLAEAAATNSRLRLAGGLAIEEIEAWVLACCGFPRSEAVSHPKERFGELFPDAAQREGKVAIIERAGLHALPADAASFRLWLSRIRSALAG